jgi:hypothetical protein
MKRVLSILAILLAPIFLQAQGTDLAVAITDTRTFNNGVWEVEYVITYQNLTGTTVTDAEVTLTISDDDPALGYHSSSVSGALTSLTHGSGNSHVWSGTLVPYAQGSITVLFKSSTGQVPEYGPYYTATATITDEGDTDPSNNIDWVIFHPSQLQ